MARDLRRIGLDPAGEGAGRIAGDEQDEPVDGEGDQQQQRHHRRQATGNERSH